MIVLTRDAVFVLITANVCMKTLKRKISLDVRQNRIGKRIVYVYRLKVIITSHEVILIRQT